MAEKPPSRETSHLAFMHPRNMIRGKARLLYAQATALSDGTYLPEGWVAPGGRRIQDADEAERVCWEMDRLMA